MGYTGIIILFAFILAWLFVQSFKTFENDESTLYKVLGVVICVLASAVLIFFCIGLREEIRYVTPAERAEWDYKTAVGVAEALSKSQVRWVPEVMIAGQNGNSFNPLDTVGYNYLLDIAKKQSK